MLNSINLEQGNLTAYLIHCGQGHDARFAETVNSMIPENGVRVMARGLASWEFLDELSITQTHFVVRIKNNLKTEFDHHRYRVVWFCDLESHSEFRLATNLEQLTNEEIGAIYRNRWQIEILWNFLKMHLKLDHLISKNVNGVTM